MHAAAECDHCGRKYLFRPPLPPEGTRFRCRCGRTFSVNYPGDGATPLQEWGEGEPPILTPPRGSGEVDRPDKPAWAARKRAALFAIFGLVKRYLPHRRMWEGRGGKGGGIFRNILLGFACAVALSIALGGAYISYLFLTLGKDLPPLNTLRAYRPPTVTEVYAEEGDLIGEFFEFRRYVIPLEEISPVTIQAFLCAEDSDFYSHRGIDYKGIVRAAWKNILSGRFAQGGSTITQQVARSFLLSRERKLERKVKEIILAREIERNFSKDYILYLYLNQIYLGQGAYGVESAARIYFGKRAEELDLSESALIAGLIQAPTRYSPYNNYHLSKERQKYVLNEMFRKRKIDREEMREAYNKDLQFLPLRDVNLEISPYFTEHVRKELVKKYGHKRVYQEGLRVHTTLNAGLMGASRMAVNDGVRRIDRRMGWRGPIKKGLEKRMWGDFLKQYEREERLKHASPQEIFQEELLPPFTPEEGMTCTGVVQGVEERSARILLPGGWEGIIPLEGLDWAYPYNPKLYWKYREKIKNASRVLKEGDVVLVKVEDDEYRGEGGGGDVEGRGRHPLLLSLDQEPLNDAAILSLRVNDGAIISMVGGKDFRTSEFNRVTQARRQCGSAFKPIVYASALDYPDKGFNPSTILVDSPMAMPKGSDFKELWRPDNYGDKFMGDVTFRKGLILSRNIVTIKILQEIGIDHVLNYARKLGIESPLNEDLSLGLGSSSLTLMELCKTFLVFPNLGKRVEPYFIKEIIDRDGKVIYRHKPPPPSQVISADTAYVITSLLMDVVRAGTGRGALELKVPTAGKTGTTNDFIDAWYIGFTPSILCGVWTGFDTPKSMGYGFTGGDTALPIFVDYMREALKRYPETRFKIPPGVVFKKVDPDTGFLVKDDGDGVVVAFKSGTEPSEYAKAEGKVLPLDFFSADGFMEDAHHE